MGEGLADHRVVRGCLIRSQDRYDPRQRRGLKRPPFRIAPELQRVQMRFSSPLVVGDANLLFLIESKKKRGRGPFP